MIDGHYICCREMPCLYITPCHDVIAITPLDVIATPFCRHILRFAMPPLRHYFDAQSPLRRYNISRYAAATLPARRHYDFDA